MVQFIEYNCFLSAMGNGAADGAAGSILSMFNFHRPTNRRLFLDPSTGEPVSQGSAVRHLAGG